MPRATARHILVSSEAKCNELKAAIEGAPISPRSPGQLHLPVQP